MNTLSAGLSWIDLQFLGRAHAIGTGVAGSPGALALIDPGPTSCLATLDLGLQQQGLRMADVTDVLLTHIHLDHAGVTGTLLRDHPQIRVHVHEVGAPHLVDPSKLVASSRRLWLGEMDRLWGEVVPVPKSALHVLVGGERLHAGGRTFDVAYTPGHASHHVSYFDASSGVAFVGDTAGMSIDGGYILPPTPPPDIDLEAWATSIARIDAWSPSTLFVTHCGPVNAVRPHLQSFQENLAMTAALVRESLQEPGSDEERIERFVERIRLEMRRRMPESQVDAYFSTSPFHLLWLGLARYWRKKGS